MPVAQLREPGPRDVSRTDGVKEPGNRAEFQASRQEMADRAVEVLSVHPAANVYRMMNEAELEALSADIRTNGLMEAIWLHPDGSIIDGRNRYKACLAAGLEPTFRTWDGVGSLIGFVVSMNGHRRHLTSSEKAAAAVQALPFLEAEAKQRQGARTDITELIPESDKGEAREKAAEMFGTNARYVGDAKKLSEGHPDEFEAVVAGEQTITQAKRKIKEAKREERRAANQEKVKSTPDVMQSGAKFATIVIDPPWSFGDEGDADVYGRARPTYHQIPFDEIRALPVGDLADDDCHIYLWITNRSMPKGAALLEAWGFRYVTFLTWCKPSIGMGQYFRGSTEHLLFGVKGSQELKRKDVGTWFLAPRGKEHSSKPAQAYRLIESCSPGPYLDMFARGEPFGSEWSVCGADALTDENSREAMGAWRPREQP